ncbi:zinc ribbon domain-containing protein [Haloarchaeobius amylolyticus]|uniref:Zinc ribbon domain-containing protein n=1 Tax=Haloarchaeobius amylolyticus TaxID=1198296 RepID=A0ABD6BKK7_9EURY
MVAPDQLYAAVVGVLLLAALGVSIPVLMQIVRDGLERRRKRQAGELERYTEDKEYDRFPAVLSETADGRTRLTCSQCGAENDASYTYCRRCTTPL